MIKIKDVREELKQIEKATAKMRFNDRYRMGAEHVIKRLREFIRKWQERQKAHRGPH